MTTKRALLILSVFSLLASSPAMAVGGGFYLGGSVGGASTEVKEGNFTFDESDTAWKLFAGYHFLQFFAVEAAYRNLGSPSDAGVKVEPTAFDVAGLAGIPLGPIYLFGKLGIVQWDADVKGSVSGSDDGTDYEAGIGASIDITKIQLRAEVEYIDAADGIVMYSLGAAWRF